jgi:hypothetical protein
MPTIAFGSIGRHHQSKLHFAAALLIFPSRSTAQRSGSSDGAFRFAGPLRGNARRWQSMNDPGSEFLQRLVRTLVEGPSEPDPNRAPTLSETLLPWPVRVLAVVTAALLGWNWTGTPLGEQLGGGLQYAGLIAISLAVSYWSWVRTLPCLATRNPCPRSRCLLPGHVGQGRSAARPGHAPCPARHGPRRCPNRRARTGPRTTAGRTRRPGCADHEGAGPLASGHVKTR